MPGILIGEKGQSTMPTFHCCIQWVTGLRPRTECAGGIAQERGSSLSLDKLVLCIQVGATQESKLDLDLN